MSGQLLIVGAGYTGMRLAARLHADGKRVFIASRNPQPTDTATAIALDLDTPGETAARLQEALATGQQLSVAYLVPPKDLDPQQQGEEPRLAALLAALPVKPHRVVLASTSGVYGDHDGARVDEQTPLQPATRRAHNRVRLERTLVHWADTCGAGYVILRIAGIYGPGRLPLRSIREHQPIIDPQQSGPGNRIHVDDLVTTFVAALESPDPPQLVNVADGDHCPTPVFTQAVAELAGLDAPPVISLAEAQREYSPMRLSFINESRLLDNRRLTGALGVELRYPTHRAGISASLDEEPTA